jgi:carbamoyltransferase
VNILGINSAYHESAACLIKDGVLITCVEEERFNRRKHAKQARIDNPHELPWQAIQYCLEAANIKPGDIDIVGFSFNPNKRLHNKNLQDIVADGSWGSTIGEETFYQYLIQIPESLKSRGFNGNFRWIDHHVCHAASAYLPSPFDQAAILSLDGIGEICSTATFAGEGNTIKVIDEINYPASLGFLWEKFSIFLGFSEYDAYKVMGLASYGDAVAYQSQFGKLYNLLPNGRYELDNQTLQFRSEDFSEVEKLFGIQRRGREEKILEAHKDLAAALQETTNKVVLHLTRNLHKQMESDNLCLAGGVALNCIANRLAFEEGPFSQIFIQPAAHDAGTAMGAALHILHCDIGKGQREAMKHSYLGPSFSPKQIEHTLEKQQIAYKKITDIESTTARLISQGYVVGWFQGAMEFGPRALGNRCILADPRNPDIRAVLNAKVKHREAFRPFAPSVLIEKVDQWFHIRKPTQASDYMLIAYPTKEQARKAIPAVVHVDGSSRVQTVREDQNPKYHKMLTSFYEITGVPMVLNTSFNDREPIVCSPEDALTTFKKTGIDYLAIGDYLVERDNLA